MTERKFPYPKGRYHFLLKVHFALMVVVSVLGIVMLSIGTDKSSVSMIVIIGILSLIILMIPTAVSPLITSHGVSMDAVTLRQGHWFSLKIPIEKIKYAKSVDEYVSPGIRFSNLKPYLYVTNSRYANVVIHLKERIKVKKGEMKMVNKIFLDLIDGDDFIESIMSQIKYHNAVKKIDKMKRRKKDGIKVMQAKGKMPKSKMLRKKKMKG